MALVLPTFPAYIHTYYYPWLSLSGCLSDMLLFQDAMGDYGKKSRKNISGENREWDSQESSNVCLASDILKLSCIILCTFIWKHIRHKVLQSETWGRFYRVLSLTPIWMTWKHAMRPFPQFSNFGHRTTSNPLMYCCCFLFRIRCAPMGIMRAAIKYNLPWSACQ